MQVLREFCTLRFYIVDSEEFDAVVNTCGPSKAWIKVWYLDRKRFLFWDSLLKAFFPVLLYRGLNSHSSDCSTFLRSTCIKAGWQILHRERISCTSIESCQRILYFKILHCRLRGISMPLLTHVLYNFIEIVSNLPNSRGA